MSVDLYLEPPPAASCPSCGHSPVRDDRFETNFTYNYGPMWRRATGRGKTADVDGLTGTEASAIFKAAIEAVENDWSAFVRLEPGNGWGTVPMFVKRLKDCLAACLEDPDWTWRACR